MRVRDGADKKIIMLIDDGQRQNHCLSSIVKNRVCLWQRKFL